MASFSWRCVVACWAIGFLGTTLVVEAAPPRRPTTTTRRPATTSKPTTPPKAPLTVKPSESTGTQPAPAGPMPQPPQPKREEDVSTGETTKPAIPHPAVSAEVKATPKNSGTDAPVSPKTAAPTIDVRPDADGKYNLRYHFSTGETIRWRVEHRAKIVTSVQGSTQTAETVTISTKAWKVVETLPGGETRFVHTVEAIEMRQKLTGRQEITYNSETDKDVPPIFADAAKQIGVPLAEATIDARGGVLKISDMTPRPTGAPAQTITLILPDRPLAIGESWTSPFDLQAVDAEGRPKSIKARNKLTLEQVENGVAVIRNETQILSPLDDPRIEAQVIQAEQSGTVTFDLRRGRIVEQRSALDKEVFGFEGPESKLHYTTTFGETLLEARTAVTADADAPKSGNPLR
jgi:hypothetical protein